MAQRLKNSENLYRILRKKLQLRDPTIKNDGIIRFYFVISNLRYYLGGPHTVKWYDG